MALQSTRTRWQKPKSLLSLEAKTMVMLIWTLLKCSLMGSGRQVLFNAYSKNVLICSSCYIWLTWENCFFIFFFIFLLTLGPPLPKGICCFSMLEMRGDTHVIGGLTSPGAYQSSIYRLSCSSGICSWSTLNQQLKVARDYPVAIEVQDHFCT